MPFQVNSKFICLTYPHCDVDLELIKQHFYATFSGHVIAYFIACSETHKDGSFHRHAGIAFATAFRSRNERVFDIRGRNNGQSFHPNIQSARRFSAWVQYVKKAGDFIEEGELDNNKSERITPERLVELAKELSLVDFLAFCSVNRYQMAKDIWHMVHEDRSLTIEDGDIIEGDIDEKFKRLTNRFVWNPNLTLLIIGEAGIGKTTWAKTIMPKPILFVSHMDDLRKFNPNRHKSILFDDVSITHMPETAQIHLVDQENPRSIHVRYGTVRIPARMPKVFTCNTFPVTHNINAIKRRTQLLLCYQDDLDSYF